MSFIAPKPIGSESCAPFSVGTKSVLEEKRSKRSAHQRASHEKRRARENLQNRIRSSFKLDTELDFAGRCEHAFTKSKDTLSIQDLTIILSEEPNACFLQKLIEKGFDKNQFRMLWRGFVICLLTKRSINWICVQSILQSDETKQLCGRFVELFTLPKYNQFLKALSECESDVLKQIQIIQQVYDKQVRDGFFRLIHKAIRPEEKKMVIPNKRESSSSSDSFPPSSTYLFLKNPMQSEVSHFIALPINNDEFAQFISECAFFLGKKMSPILEDPFSSSQLEELGNVLFQTFDLSQKINFEFDKRINNKRNMKTPCFVFWKVFVSQVFYRANHQNILSHIQSSESLLSLLGIDKTQLPTVGLYDNFIRQLYEHFRDPVLKLFLSIQVQQLIGSIQPSNVRFQSICIIKSLCQYMNQDSSISPQECFDIFLEKLCESVLPNSLACSASDIQNAMIRARIARTVFLFCQLDQGWNVDISQSLQLQMQRLETISSLWLSKSASPVTIEIQPMNAPFSEEVIQTFRSQIEQILIRSFQEYPIESKEQIEWIKRICEMKFAQLLSASDPFAILDDIMLFAFDIQQKLLSERSISLEEIKALSFPRAPSPTLPQIHFVVASVDFMMESSSLISDDLYQT